MKPDPGSQMRAKGGGGLDYYPVLIGKRIRGEETA